MDQLVQCPVCTLYLHNGITLESHLDTHPKDQVIKALCTLATSKGNYTSRTSSPLHSERSYRSRSRTPATEEKWNGSHRTGEHERYWRRTPSRTPKSTASTNISRVGTPDMKIPDSLTFETGSTSGQNSLSSYVLKQDKLQQTFQNSPMSDFEQTGGYYQDPQDDREIKYSRSTEYNSMDNGNGVYTYNVPSPGAGLRYPTHSSLISNIPARKGSGFVKIVQKPNNIFVKTDTGSMQYLHGAKPMHVMVPGTQTFVQKNMQNNMIIPGNIPQSQVQIDPKGVPQQLAGNQFNQFTTGNYTPGLSTVVTQNSQIIYREMLHNIDGKQFISSVPAVVPTGPDNMPNTPQAAAMYQNLMVVDQFGSCMYTNPQQVLPKPGTPTMYTESATLVSSMDLSKTPVPAAIDDPKTLIIEVGPIVAPEQVASCSVLDDHISDTTVKSDKYNESDVEKIEPKCETPVSTKGLKILSNIKVEVPVQHNKNMINTIMDLTGSNDPEYSKKEEYPESPEKILSDIEEKKENIIDDNTQPSTSSIDSVVSHAFSVIKNVGNPSSQKDLCSKSLDSKLDMDYSDSCPVPDLICNEKASISPCSELSESGENSTDRTSISTKVEPNNSQLCENIETVERKVQVPNKPNRLNLLRLNNIYVKKNKKVLKIKNAKQKPEKSLSIADQKPIPSSSSRKSPENFAINKVHRVETSAERECSILHTVSVEEIKQNENNDESNEKHDFDADTEEQAMDIEPISTSHLRTTEFITQVDMVQVKEEISTSNEGGFSNETVTSERILTPLETLRPISVVSYGNVPPGEFDDESNHRELLDLEAASKNKQFVSMMNENYFGDNIYADYFTPDRVESFSHERDAASQKDGIYGIWGEPSQKENEFVLPNFIHESYKIAESNETDYTEMDQERLADGEGDVCERDSKAEVLSESRSNSEAPLNICADERMPPRGELSGQESNGDMESPWNGMYPEVTPSEPYDLIARESWVSDGSDVDTTEKRETLDVEVHFPKSRTHTCVQCSAKFPSAKELRTHKSVAHAPPTCSVTKTTYSRMVTARAIKKEEVVKTDDNMLACSMMAIDSKESITSTILQAYDMEDTKAKIEGFIKQETKRRRKDFVCPTCKIDQVTDAAFHAHLKIHPLECLTCGKCFFRRANLALHIKTHLGIKNYKCEVCEKRFVTRQKLAEHHNVHTGRAPVKCTLCDDTFRRYSNMVQHRDRHHFQKRMKVRDFVCQCGAVFHSRAKLLWHKETHDEKPKSCPYCSDKFVHAASLTRHMRRSHNEYYLSEKLKGKVDNVPCPICKQVYLRTNLRSHLQTHSGKRPYVCIICNKAFTTKWNLKLHRWTHLSRSAKPFKCHLCKGAFIRHTEYVSHMNAHKSVRPYTCNYCGCQFIRKYNCQRHVREHEMAKKYVCKVPECGKSFHRSYYLSEHMKVHSGARPFACNICGKTSSNKSNHNKHVKIHHAREPVATEA